MSKSTQWDLYRVINRPPTLRTPTPLLQVLLTIPWLYLTLLDIVSYFSSDYNSLLSKEKGKIHSSAWTLAHLFIRLILFSKSTPGSGLSDRQLEERISSEEGIASLKSHGNLLIDLYQLISARC